MFIQNVSYADIPKGYHYDPGPNSMLIQIVDGGLEFPKPLYQFREVHQYCFFDIEPGDAQWEDLKDGAFTQEQARDIIKNLIHAHDNRMNVIVHCVAGVCRSGAVVEVAVAAMGFNDPEVYRSPNTYVKWKLFHELEEQGWFERKDVDE